MAEFFITTSISPALPGWQHSLVYVTLAIPGSERKLQANVSAISVGVLTYCPADLLTPIIYACVISRICRDKFVDFFSVSDKRRHQPIRTG